MGTATRVIKNTGFLYVKNIITVVIALYSTSLILGALGASDYGIFTVVGGSISMLGFLNSTMANATQRFMSYAEGEGILEKKIKVFNVSMILHIGIALITFLFLFIAFYPFFNGVLNIEPSRIYAAKIVYWSLIFSTMLTITNVPYDAIMNAHENMLYYSIIGILAAFLKLGIAFFCVYSSSDKLILYGILTPFIPLITLTITKVYCHRHYEECVLKPFKYYDFSLIKSIATFSGWNFLTAITNLFTLQGLGIILNRFFGTTLNAAQGIAHQVNSQLRGFSGNMNKALNPVIVKNVGAKNTGSMKLATLAGNKYSTFLTIIFAIPLIIEMPYVLELWLKKVPEWSVLFCRLQLVQSIVSSTAASHATAIYATGKIKHYAIYKSIMNLLPLFFTYLCFKLGGGPFWLYIPMIAFWSLGGNIVILYFAKKLCGLSLEAYFNKIIKPVVVTMVFMTITGLLVSYTLPEGFIRLMLCCMTTTAAMFFSMWNWGMEKYEKETFLGLINKRINHKKKGEKPTKNS